MGASQNSKIRPPFDGRYARRLQMKRERRHAVVAITDEDIHPELYCSECGCDMEHDDPAWASAVCMLCEWHRYERDEVGLLDCLEPEDEIVNRKLRIASGLPLWND